MKKLAKLLVLLFAVITVLTAFTLVSSAEEVTEEPKYHFYKMRESWEGVADGTFIGNNVDRYGNMTAKWTDDGTEKGNYYVLYQPKANANGNTATNLDDIDFASSKTYNIGDYPYIMLSYDIMTPTGSFNNPLIYLKGRYTKDNGSTDYVTGTYTYNFGIVNGSLLPHLDKTPYHWQHISVIIEPVYTVYEAGQEGVDEKNVGKISSFKYIITMYVNDKFAYTYTTGNYASMTGYLPTRLGHNQIRINTTGASKTNDATALDNLSISYFKADFATSEETKYSEMVAAVYNEEYKLPYGQTVAMIGDVKYQDIDDAIAAADEDDIIKLMCDQVESPLVEKKVSFDRNDGNGGLYNITVTSPMKFAQSESDGILTVSEVKAQEKPITGTWESKVAGTEIWVTGQTWRYGHLFVGESYNKENKYIIFEPRENGYKENGTLASENNYIEPALDNTLENQGTKENPDYNFVYNHADYPYVALDFDIMTPTGKYDDGITFPMRTQHTAKNAASGTGTYINFYATVTANQFSAYLDSTPYTWNHVTIVYHYDKVSDTTAYYRYYVYVNGGDEYVYTGYRNLTNDPGEGGKKFMEFDPSDLGFTALRINGTDLSPEGRQSALDNLNVTFFASNFGTTADMAKHIYKEDYKFPFGDAVADVDGRGYETLAEAIEAAKATDHKTVRILKDLTDAKVTSDEVIIDINKYDENGVATGEFYAFDYVDGDYKLISDEGGKLTFINKDKISATVNWIINGEIYKTEKVLWGTTAIAPEVVCVLENDLYRDAMYQWVNENGVADFTIAKNTDVVNFTAALTVDGYTNYIAGVKDARLNFTYYAQLSTNFYLPVVEGMDAPAVSISNSMKTVYISGQKFWCYTNYGTTTSVFNDTVVTVTYKIDGVEYTQKYMVSGLIYAEIVLNDPTATDLEKCAVANMVRFVRECLQVYGSTSIPYDRINALIGSEDGTVKGIYELDDYLPKDQYPDSDCDAAELDKYLESVSFTLRGSYASYIFTKTDLAIKKGVTFTVVNAKGVAIALRDPGTAAPWTLNLRVYDAIETITITAHIPAEINPETGEIIAEATTLSAKYSMGSYIKATDNELMKAVYAFGTAARNYVENRKDY